MCETKWKEVISEWLRKVLLEKKILKEYSPEMFLSQWRENKNKLSGEFLFVIKITFVSCVNYYINILESEREEFVFNLVKNISFRRILFSQLDM